MTEDDIRQMHHKYSCIAWGVTRVSKQWYWLVGIDGPQGSFEELCSGYAPTREEAKQTAGETASRSGQERALRFYDVPTLTYARVADHRREYAPECEKLRERDRQRKERHRRWREELDEQLKQAAERGDREAREQWEMIEQMRRRTEQFMDDMRQQLRRFGLGPTYAENLKVLGLTPPVTRLEIRTAYLKLAKVHHPDAGGSADAFRRIETAYRAVLARA
jgi:hypothetical protein